MVIEALADSDQYAEAHLRMAATPADVFAFKTFLDCIQKGFTAKIGLEHPQCLFGIIEELPLAK